MKLSQVVENSKQNYPNKLIIVKKWIFWILTNEQAFFMSKMFNMKLTKLDKDTIKAWFPEKSLNKWLQILEDKRLSYMVLQKDKQNGKYQIIKNKDWTYFNKLFVINQEDYEFTKQRILWLAKVWLEEKIEKNFLLKDKLEEIYLLLSHRLIKMPRKERYYFREKIEKIYMDMLENVYKYMYNLEDRKELIKNIQDKVFVLREFTRFLYKIGRIRNDNYYLDLGERWIEIMKICKGVRNKIS